jgi:predicted nucleotidyltransferase
MAVAPGQLASVLRRRQRERLERAAELATHVRAHIAALVEALGLSQQVWLIGSLAWGGFDESSDVDLVVEGVSERRLTQLWCHLERELKRSVDLLRFEDLPESFRSRVLGEGVRLDVS